MIEWLLEYSKYNFVMSTRNACEVAKDFYQFRYTRNFNEYHFRKRKIAKAFAFEFHQLFLETKLHKLIYIYRLIILNSKLLL